MMTITKALLPSDVAYEGGYQDAPISNWTDVPVQVKGYLDELGVHAQACSNEASAAAMLLECAFGLVCSARLHFGAGL